MTFLANARLHRLEERHRLRRTSGGQAHRAVHEDEVRRGPAEALVRDLNRAVGGRRVSHPHEVEDLLLGRAHRVGGIVAARGEPPLLERGQVHLRGFVVGIDGESGLKRLHRLIVEPHLHVDGAEIVQVLEVERVETDEFTVHR